jgi:hypothetical protein
MSDMNGSIFHTFFTEPLVEEYSCSNNVSSVGIIMAFASDGSEGHIMSLAKVILGFSDIS